MDLTKMTYQERHEFGVGLGKTLTASLGAVLAAAPVEQWVRMHQLVGAGGSLGVRLNLTTEGVRGDVVLIGPDGDSAIVGTATMPLQASAARAWSAQP